MGPVFRAYDPDGERLVAVKRFRLDLPPERVHQLVAEFKTIVAARLVHPAIATPVAAGIVEASAYLAQEFVAAESLDAVIRDHGALSVADALRAADQLAGGLDFAATAGVEHGGLHPRDVLLAGDQARLAGLGVVRALERVGAAAPVRRPYTAPERISGTAWSSRADVFSLAALVHEMLWGRRVSGMGQAAAESLTEIAGGDLAKLRQAFARALDESPDARFETGSAFVEALKHAFCEQPPATSHQVAAVGGEPPVAEAGTPAPGVEPTVTNEEPPVASDQLPAAGSRPPATKVNVRQSRRSLRLSPLDRGESSPERLPRHDSPDRRPRHDAEARLPLDASAMVGERELEKEMPAPTAPEFAETTLPGNWPLAIALAIGVAVGFAGGYGVGTRSRSEAPPATPGVAAAGDVRPPVSSVVQGQAAAAIAPTARASGTNLSEPITPAASVPRAGDAAASTTPPVPPLVSRPEARTPKAAAVPIVTGSIVVRSTPAGAKVLVDGKDYGRTPLTVRDLARGAHRVQVTREGFVGEDRRLTITTAKAQLLTVQLARPRPAAPATRKPSIATAAAPAAAAGRGPGPLVVESRPAGAKVFLDGRLIGTTPMSAAGIAAGEHAVRLEHEGYRNWSASVRIEGGEPNRVTASLER